MARRWRGRKGQGAAEGSQARIARNTLANTSGTLITVIVGLLLSPLMIHKLGVEAYGVWILATTFTYGLGYLSFADLGLEYAAVRFVAEARSGGDAEEMNRIWVSTFAVLTGIALLLVPPLVLLTGSLVDLFSIPADLRSEAIVAFTCVIAQLLIELPARAFAALLEGSQRYGLWQLTRIVQTLSITALVVVVLLTGGGIDWVGRATLAAQLVPFTLLALFARFAIPGSRFSPRLISGRVIRKLAGFGGQLLVFRILSSVYRPMDKIIVGIALSAAAVTVYEVANKMYLGAALLQSVAASALFPATAFSRKDPQRLREMLLRGSSYALAFALPFIVAAFVFADPLIRTWIGEAQTSSVTPARLLLLELVPGFAIVVGQTMLSGLGVMRRMIWLNLGWTVLNIGLSIALVGPMGVDGVCLATVVSTTILFFPLTWLFLREIGVGAVEWTKDVIVPVLPGIVAQAGVALLLLPIANGSGSLLVVGLLCAATIAVALAVWMLVGLSSRRRRDLIRMFRETAGLEPWPMPEPDLAGDPPAPAAVSTPD